MRKHTTARSVHEIQHGLQLAQNDPEVTWGWASPAGQLRVKRRAELIARRAQLAPGVRALEIGCGTGLFTELFAQTGASLLAVDISAALLDIARARNLPDDQVQFMAKRFEDCKVEGPFDAIIGSSVLHHLEVEESLAKIYRLLKPGGIMSFAEPNMMNPQVAIQKNVPWIKERLGDSPDETAFIRWRMRRLLIKMGFVEIEIVPYDWLHPVTPAPFISGVQRLSYMLEKIPVVREFAGSLLICCRRPLEIQYDLA